MATKELHTSPLPTLVRIIPPSMLTRRRAKRDSTPWGLVEAVGLGTLLLAMLGSTLAGFQVARASSPHRAVATHVYRPAVVVAAESLTIDEPDTAPSKAPTTDEPAPVAAPAPPPRAHVTKTLHKAKYPWMQGR
jgi:hypothetical protein